MLSELKLLKQHITELKAKNAELRKENTAIPGLRNKLLIFDIEIAELKHRNAKILKASKKYNKRRNYRCRPNSILKIQIPNY
jgi:FtsZ-binding cell division protein ZapB